MMFKSLLSAAAFVAVVSANVVPRQFSGTWSGSGTYFNPGVGACGISNSDADYIVAVGHDLFDTYPGYSGGNPNANPICGRTLTATYGGRSVNVQIVDRCVGCAEFDLDFSPAAFSALADLSLGRIPVTWTWN